MFPHRSARSNFIDITLLGKHIVRLLLARSTPVTVLDVIFHADELQAIRDDYPEAASLLTVVVGDIRDPDALRGTVTPDVAGVIHLAAVSRVLWCLNNEPDCMDINVRGTQLVLDALTILNRGDSGKRWLLLASSRGVYGNGNSDGGLITEDDDKIPANVYGSSKLKAEQVIERHLASSDSGKMSAIALRLSNVYGGVDDHVERLVPSLMTQALSNQLIQIVGGKQNVSSQIPTSSGRRAEISKLAQLDMLHIDDCMAAFMLAIDRLERSRTSRFSFGRNELESFNVASGSLARSQDLVDTIIGLFDSKSPVQSLTGDDRFPNVYRGSTAKAAKILGFKAKIDIDEGILRLARAYLTKTERFLTKKIATRCDVPAPVDLQKLDQCSILFMGSIAGHLDAIKPDHDYWTTTRTIQPSDPKLQAPLMYLAVRTTQSGVTKVIISQGKDGPRLTLPAGHGSSPQPGFVNLKAVKPAQLVEGDVSEWDMTVDAETGTVRLILPRSNLHLAPPILDDDPFSLVPKNDDDPGLFRITPICCPTPGPWPFSKDNRECSISNLRRGT